MFVVGQQQQTRHNARKQSIGLTISLALRITLSPLALPGLVLPGRE